MQQHHHNTSNKSNDILSCDGENAKNDGSLNQSIPLDLADQLKGYRTKHSGKLIFATLNVNSLRYKFDEIASLISGNIDVLVLNETKLDSSFPTEQFFIQGFSPPYRVDRTGNGGGTMIYVREDIPSKELTRHTFKDHVEGIFIELNFRKYKLLVLGTYRPPNFDKELFFNSISNSLDLYLTHYERFVLLGDFNVNNSCSNTDPIFNEFIDQYESKNIVKEPTCFKNPENPSILDLVITNRPKSFWNTKTFRNSISDFHSLVATVLNIKYTKAIPKVITYRDYKKFNLNSFQRDLLTVFGSGCNDYETFEKMFLSTLNLHAPLKSKTIRANHKPYMNKAVRKSIMKKNHLYTKWVKSGNQHDKVLFKDQKKLTKKYVKQTKKEYFHNLSDKDVLDTKLFWKQIKSSFTDKVSLGQKITLVDKGETITGDKEQAEIFRNFFSEAVANLDIKENPFILDETSVDNQNLNEIEKIIFKFKNHPSIIQIKKKVGNTGTFKFRHVSQEEVFKQLKNLNGKKATTYQNIPCKSLKDNAKVLTETLTYILNKDISNNLFPNGLKTADVPPIFKKNKIKKNDPTDKKYYRPVSVLPSTSKIYERLMQIQIVEFITDKLSPFLCGYRKGFSAQHALISLIENWRKTLDKKGYAGAILMDLSKAFDCINHNLLIAKLEAYGFDINALKMMKSYLSDRRQRIKVNNSFSSWADLLTGVPQGSVLGPLLFNIYINDLFWVNEYSQVCNLADDTTYHATDMELKELIRKLEHDSSLALEWFENNYMKLNTDKCHLLIAGHKHEHIFAKIGKDMVWETKEERLLGITIDNQLQFKHHIADLCRTAHNKLSALIRYSSILNFEKRRTLLKSFIESQFSYSPLTWMFHDRGINAKINRIHERALRCVYRDDRSSFEQLLKKDNSCSIHHRNIQAMTIEMYKLKNNLGPSLLIDIFNLNNQTIRYNLRENTDFLIPNVKTVHYGKDSLQYFGSVIWKLIPIDIRLSTSINDFKNKIKNWTPPNCPCRLCKTFVQGLGYMNVVE